MDPIFQLENIRHAYQIGKPVLEIDRFSIPPQRIIGLIGPNGSGKSTLLRLLACIEKPTSGIIRFKGVPVTPFHPLTRFNISMLVQEPYLLRRSVFQNVAYGLYLQKQKTGIRRAVHTALEQVGLDPSIFSHRKWYALSGGEAQRVALAARLVLKPAVLLMDEPTASVDANSIHLLKSAVRNARRQWGAALIIASHDWDWLDTLCDETYHLFRGRILGSGRHNIIFGPWAPAADGLFAKVLNDGQHLLVPPPPDNNAVAVLNAADISVITTEKQHPEQRLLKARITRLSEAVSTSHILLTFTVSDLSLHVEIPTAQAGEHRYAPGELLSIAYIPKAVSWLENN